MSLRIEHNVTINRPIEEVSALLSNPENASQWQSDVLECRPTSEGPMSVGATVRDVRTFLGRRIEWTYEVTEYEANRKLAFKATSGPMPFEGTWTFEPVEDDSRLTFVAVVHPGGFFRLAEPLVGRMMSRRASGGYDDGQQVNFTADIAIGTGER